MPTGVDFLELRGDEFIVDVGCGTGGDLRRLAAGGHRGRLVGVDLSIEHVARLPVSVAFRVAADAAVLGLRDAVADVVLAKQVLHLVGDIPGAIQELRRVLRPAGVLVVAQQLTHPDNLVELWNEALSAAAGRPVEPVADPVSRLGADGGRELLAKSFSTIEEHTATGEALLTDPRLVRASAGSCRDLYGAAVPNPAVWASGVEALERRAAELIARAGAIRLSVETVTFVCR